MGRPQHTRPLPPVKSTKLAHPNRTCTQPATTRNNEPFVYIRCEWTIQQCSDTRHPTANPPGGKTHTNRGDKRRYIFL